MKALLPMLVTLAGMLTVARLVQPLKAPSLMLVTPSLITTVVISLL